MAWEHPRISNRSHHKHHGMWQAKQQKLADLRALLEPREGLSCAPGLAVSPLALITDVDFSICRWGEQAMRGGRTSGSCVTCVTSSHSTTPKENTSALGEYCTPDRTSGATLQAPRQIQSGWRQAQLHKVRKS